MKAWKIKFDSECKERSLAKKLVGPNLEVEMVPFTFHHSQSGSEEIRRAPMAYVPILAAKIKQLLDQNDK